MWKQYLAQKLIDDNHPTRAESKCLNTLQTKHPCTVCQGLCPYGVFDKADPSWESCDNCGVCAAACPTRCLSPGALHSSSLLELCRRTHEDVFLGCSQYGGASDAILPCLASFPWELIVFFALQGQVSLLCGNCETCEKKVLFVQLEHSLQQVRTFLGDDLFQDRVLPPSQVSEKPPRRFSRREAFSLLFSKTKSTVGGLLPASADLIPDGTIWRQLLVHRLHGMDPSGQFHWTLPMFTDICSGCGICVRLCPVQALHRVQDPQESTLWHMAMIPWRCTGCDLCVQACPVEGLTPSSPTPLEDPVQPLLYKVSAAACSRCGTPLDETDPSGLCSRCRGEAQKTILW